MKKTLIVVLLLVSWVSNAQLTLTDLSTNLPIVDGDVFEYDQLASPSTSDGKLEFLISNSSTTETIRVLGQMVSFSNTNGNNCQFCVNPECFFAVSPGQTIPNTPVVLAPGANNGNFDSFYNSDPGDNQNYPISYTLRFFMVDDNGNEVGDDIVITYNYTPENFSNRDFDLEDLGITLQNTVVNDFLNLNSEFEFSLKIYDVNSRLVSEFRNVNGINKLDLSSLSNGYYLAQFTNANNQTSTVKILKQ